MPLSLSSTWRILSGKFLIYNLCIYSDEPKAESECERCLAEALKIDAENVDALQTLANLRFIRAKDEEAKVLLKKAVKIMLNSNLF